MRKLITIGVAMLAMAFVGTTTASPVSRANAVRTAHEYLQTQAFSYKSLYTQLKFEGYSSSDSAYAASHCGANWSREAVLDAKEYMSTQPFSRSGLISQLEFEGFTAAQATHGANAVGL